MTFEVIVSEKQGVLAVPTSWIVDKKFEMCWFPTKNLTKLAIQKVKPESHGEWAKLKVTERLNKASIGIF